MSGRIICVDFDGVLHQYTQPWSGYANISDGPVEGAFAWLLELLDANWEVNIYSSRSKEEEGIQAMRKWFAKHDFPILRLDQLKFPTQKPAASMTVDDRAFCFQGDYPSMDWLRRFRPWNKR